MIDKLCKRNSDKNPKSWFKKYEDKDLGWFYNGSVVKRGFND